MSYTYDTSHTSAQSNWMKGRNGNKVQGITIHHWGSGKTLDFYGIVNYLCSARPSNPTSAHYVVQGRTQTGAADRRVACIVDPDDTAYHAGNWQANLTEIGIECRPYPTDADYDVIAELVMRLRSVYGPVPLYPHKHWTSTDCPGEIDVAKIDRLAKAKAAAPAPPAPPKETSNVALSSDDIKNIWVGSAADVIPAPRFLPPDQLKANPTWVPGTFLQYTLEDTHAIRDTVNTLATDVKNLSLAVSNLVTEVGNLKAASAPSLADLQTALKNVLGSLG